MRRMLNLLKSIFFKRNNFIPLFPIVKILVLIALYLFTGDRSIFIFSISFISVSFFIRLISGNPFALTKKFMNEQMDLGSYRILCLSIAAVTCAGYFIIRLYSPEFGLALLIASSKLIEASVSSILFQMSMNKDRDIWKYGYYFFGSAIIFLSMTYYFDVVSAIIVDILLMGVVAISLSDYFVGGSKLMSSLPKLLASNYEISATVFPVSIFVIWYGSFADKSQVDLELLGALALAFSVAGFFSRPASLWASYLNGFNYKKLTELSHCISLIVFFVVILNAEYSIPFFNFIMSGFLVVSVVIQNFIRINFYSNHDFSLIKLHLVESLLILFTVINGASVLHASVLLFLTRTFRLIYISRAVGQGVRSVG